MPVIYLDHNIIQYYSIRFPKTWDASQERLALSSALGSNSNRFAISLGGIAEAGEDAAAAEQFIELLNQIRPLFLSERLAVQRLELEVFLFTRCFHVGDTRKPADFAVNAHFSQALSTMGDMRNHPLVGYTMARMIRHLVTHPADRARIKASKELVTSAIRANVAQRLLDPKALDSPDHLRSWLRDLLPERGPDRLMLTGARRASLLEYCVTQFADLRAACPSLEVEHFLTDFRSSQPARNPELSDAIDFQNLVMGLAYCDVLVSNDGYVMACADYCRKRCSSTLARPVRRLSEAVELVGAPPLQADIPSPSILDR